VQEGKDVTHNMGSDAPQLELFSPHKLYNNGKP